MKMKMKMKTVLAVDPGKVSGLCLATVSGDSSLPQMVESSELDSPGLWESCRRILSDHNRSSTEIFVVCEQFTIGVATSKMSFQPWSLENIGAIRCIMHDLGMDPQSIVMQSASAAKTIVNNDMLRDVGLWYRGGAGHANDAARHVLVYMLTMGWRPPWLSSETNDQ